MRMKSTRARALAALLALVMALTLAPAAAATELCTDGTKNHKVEKWETVIEADCITGGLRRGYCSACKKTVYDDEVGLDPDNHAAACDDNGDGTHSGVCAHHKTSVAITREAHHFIDGICKQCGAIDYEDVTMNLEPNRTVHVPLGDAGAKLSAGDIRLTLEKAGRRVDITENYSLSYGWSYRSSSVGTGAEYALPASVYDNEGVYYYTLMVTAEPRGTTSRLPVVGTCTFTVQVEELVTASAVVTTQEDTLRLDELDSWSADSVSGQIYEAVQDLCPRTASPEYVVFTDVPSTDAGHLDANTKTRYFFDPVKGQAALDDVQFLRGTSAGAYTASFTVYDTSERTYAGVLTITVQQYLGDMDVLFTTGKNTPVALSSQEFEAFWQRVYPGGALDSVSFDETPKTIEGTLYVDYVSLASPGDRVRTSDMFYVEPGRNEYGIDAVTFYPGAKQAEYVTLDFTAYGTRSGSRSTTRRSGTMYIFLSGDGRSADVTVRAAGETALPAAEFQKAYQSATGGAGTSFYIQLLDVPESGYLYVGRTASKSGTRLTAASIQGRPFSFSDSRGETISGLTYVPGAAATESVRYVASSAQGKPLYAGKIIFTAGAAPATPATGDMTVNYDAGPSGVSFQSGSFEALSGSSADRLLMVSFTPPAAAQGTLYYRRTATSTGTALTSGSIWFSVAASAAANSMVIDDVSFVPAAGFTGDVPIPFTAITSTSRAAGSVRVHVTAADPATTPNPGTAAPAAPVAPVKPFPDVPETEWYYTYVMDLTASGVLSGYSDGSFHPSEGVTLGQTLKMVMIAAGYPEQPQTGDHWASGYLDRAKADHLLPADTPEKLDRLVSRYTIAEIAARALGLPPVPVAVSPFSDMAPTVSAAPYVMALYNVNILTGSRDAATNTMVYQGDMGIRRKEVAAIIWRMQNYVKTGDASGTIRLG